MLKTALTESWNLSHPLILAPMAGVAGGLLARAVSEAGGLGLIGVGRAATADWIGEEAAEARKAERFGMGLQLWVLSEHPELLDLVLAERPFAVSLSFGDPTPFVERIHEAGAKVISQVQTAELATQAIAAGVDALVAQGTEAGGHTGAVGTLPLLQRVLELAQPAGMPVIAAGGIATGAAIAGVLAMGAEGVWIGTRFAASDESLASSAAKAQIEGASETDTVYTRVYDIVQGIPFPEEFPGRALRSSFTERWHDHEEDLRNSLGQARADFEGAQQRGPIYAGQAVGLIRSSFAAGTVVTQLMGEAEQILRDRSRFVLGA